MLHQVSLSVPAGTTAAIVGPTGAGKSTITNLICRFYNADSGSIFIDGRDIEEIAVKHPAVREAAVFGVPDEKWGETPVAAVVLTGPDEAAAGDVRAWINERVGAKFQRVSEVVVMDDFPRNVAGKTLKRVMRDDYTRD